MPQFKETLFDVYVPVDARRSGIDPASAIVVGVSQRGKPTLLAYFEGNRFGARSMRQFAQRCVHAAGRAAVNYPTIAKSMLPADELVRVASFDLERAFITEITDPERLQAWLGDEVLPVIGERAPG